MSFSVLHDGSEPEGRLEAFLEAAVVTRRVWRRGGFRGLEPNALQVLVALALEDERTVSALVDQLALAQGTVSTALARLQDRGLVHERIAVDDKRRRVQTLTHKGKEAVGEFSRDAVARVDARRD